jgi:hypothetical protein
VIVVRRGLHAEFGRLSFSETFHDSARPMATTTGRAGMGDQ